MGRKTAKDAASLWTDALSTVEKTTVKSQPKRQRRNSLLTAEFIAWDGEGGKNPDPDDKRQCYTLFGCSTGDYIQAPSLTTDECLSFLIQMKRRYPDAIHVAFAFDYDVNMILRDLTIGQFRSLAKNGAVRYKNYRIEHISGKWLMVTYYGTDERTTIKIADMFGYFQCSFLKAIRSYIPDDPLMSEIEKIEKGKAGRNEFTYDDIEMVRSYWTTEIELMRRLAERLRELLYDVDLKITQWHGPGAIANYTYRSRNIAYHKEETPPEVYDAARFGYAGGRFELFNVGRFTGPVYSLDINSAYPAGISRLPSLKGGYWRYVQRPKTLAEFGIYHIDLFTHYQLTQLAGPVFHRDHHGLISYPWNVEGWYWTPEAKNLMEMYAGGKYMSFLDISEGWEWVNWSDRPFAFIEDIYEERRELKAKGVGSEKALKLMLNSIYGKMAQRVGWERTGKAPKWHQLEWAGWVTSRTRAQLYDVMARIPPDQLIAVETDGIYTTMNPAELGIEHSQKLGGWEIKEYREIMYVQSGIYAMQTKDGEWQSKYRGLDSSSLSPDHLREYLSTLEAWPGENGWPPITGETTRFIGYRAALMRRNMNSHRVWERKETSIAVGGKHGKRFHESHFCRACANGHTALEEPHTLVINRAPTNRDKLSLRHDIPWEAPDPRMNRHWRELKEESEGELS